jgi:predicted nuclease with TOPRIM domain
MKLIKYVDENDGKTKQSFITDDMSHYDVDKGIPYNPPDLSRIDWGLVEKELHNLLLERGLITLQDITEKGLSNAILLVVQPKIQQLYKEHPTGFRRVVPQMNGHKEKQYG